MSDLDPGQVITASLSAVGLVRTHNEDYCSEFQRPAGARLLVLADGMGGHQGGATASRIAVETIGEVFGSSQSDPQTMLREAFITANNRVYQMAADNPELRGMGTTAVSLLLEPGGGCWVAHIGDSRAYRFSRGKLEPLTADHSVVAEMVRRGLITPEEAEVHPRRNEILRSVGVELDVEPDVCAVPLESGDRFILCSDGLSGLVSDEEIAAVLQREPPSQAVGTLVDSANARGGNDNITVQIAAIPGGMTTAINTGQNPVPGAWLETDQLEEDRSRRVRRIAGFTAIVAGLLAIFLLWLVFGGGLPTQGTASPPPPGVERTPASSDAGSSPARRLPRALRAVPHPR